MPLARHRLSPRHPRPVLRRRAAAVTLTGLLTASLAVAVTTAAPAEALTRPATMSAAYAKAKGYRVGIAVLDTRTGAFYGSGYYTSTYASESVVKVFIATRLLIEGKMTGTTRTRAYKMITQSDDAIASSLYGRVGGDGLITWVKNYFHVPNLGTPPSRAGWWGNTHITPKGLVQLYAKLKANTKVAPWLLNAMHHATTHGSDGVYQFFGIPSASPGAAIKQGWGTDYNDWSFSADYNTTGFVASNRYAVAILARGPVGTYGAKIGAMLTSVARTLLPHGSFPDPVPTVTGLTRHAGSTAGGTSFTLYGTDLTWVRRVWFGSVAVSSVQMVSRFQTRVTVPAHVPDSLHVRVETDHGYSLAAPGNAYAFVGPPTTTGLTAHTGATAGGTPIEVAGTNFRDVTRVAFGSVAAKNVTVLSRYRLRATVPAGTPGTVRVVVTTRYGSSSATTGTPYTYVAAPTVTGISPGAGPTGGGTSVVITGTGLSQATRVTFGGVAGTGLSANQDGTLTVTAPPVRSPGQVDVQVSTPYGTATSAGGYTYTP